MKNLTATLLIFARVTTVALAQSDACWNERMKEGNAISKGEQAKQYAENQTRPAESDKPTSNEAAAKQKHLTAEAAQYTQSMQWVEFMQRATNTVPSPARFSELYLKEIGDFNVICETNRRSRTIRYCVSGCQPTNTAAVFTALKKMPNHTRLSQSTNSVTVDIKLPTQ